MILISYISINNERNQYTEIKTILLNKKINDNYYVLYFNVTNITQSCPSYLICHQLYDNYEINNIYTIYFNNLYVLNLPKQINQLFLLEPILLIIPLTYFSYKLYKSKKTNNAVLLDEISPGIPLLPF